MRTEEMEKAKVKVWCTKWALTQGIIEVEGRDLGDGMFQVYSKGQGDLPYYLHGEGREWHRTEYDALEQTIKMANKKIEALKKQIKKIEMDQARNRNRREAIRNSA